MRAAPNLVTTVEQLDALYDAPRWAARAKVSDTLIKPYRAFIEAAPYLMLATAGPDGVDCSSRGGSPGFARIQDANTLCIPDDRGNNRIETLRNIVRDSRVALHFLIPGCDETLRVKGHAVISADPDLLKDHCVEGWTPRVVVVVTVTQAYFHCAQAAKRAHLWDASHRVDRRSLPSINAMLAAAQLQKCRNRLSGGAMASNS